MEVSCFPLTKFTNVVYINSLRDVKITTENLMAATVLSSSGHRGSQWVFLDINVISFI